MLRKVVIPVLLAVLRYCRRLGEFINGVSLSFFFLCFRFQHKRKSATYHEMYSICVSSTWCQFSSSFFFFFMCLSPFFFLISFRICAALYYYHYCECLLNLTMFFFFFLVCLFPRLSSCCCCCCCLLFFHIISMFRFSHFFIEFECLYLLFLR